MVLPKADELTQLLCIGPASKSLTRHDTESRADITATEPDPLVGKMRNVTTEHEIKLKQLNVKLLFGAH